MARDGSGNYARALADRAPGQTITAAAWNTEFDDVGTALTQSIARDGQTVPTDNLPMGGFRHTGVDDGAARTDYASLAQVQDGAAVYLTSVSGTNTITAAAPFTMAAYATGQRFHFIAAATNTGAATLNINSIGAAAVTQYGTRALTAGCIRSGQACVVIYDGTRFQLLNPAPTSGMVVSEGTAFDATADSTTSTTMAATSLEINFAPLFSDSVIEVTAVVPRFLIFRAAGTPTERRGQFRLRDSTNLIDGETHTVGRILTAASSALANAEGSITLIQRFAATNTGGRFYRLQFASIEATNVQLQTDGVKRLIVRELRP